MIRFSLAKADAIVSTSKFMADAVDKILPNPPPVTLVPFGVDTEQFKPHENPAARTRIRIGFVKTFSKKYAPDLFIEAAAIVLRVRKDIEFVMAGRGPLINEMRRFADQCGTGDHITFPGFVPHEEVADLMRDLDIFVNCSRYDSESFGVVICEASATGLPVIATDVGGVRETLIDGETGILTPRDDANALAAAMLDLAADVDLRRRAGAAGRGFMCENYEWNQCVDKMNTTLMMQARK